MWYNGIMKRAVAKVFMFLTEPAEEGVVNVEIALKRALEKRVSELIDRLAEEGFVLESTAFHVVVE